MKENHSLTMQFGSSRTLSVRYYFEDLHFKFTQIGTELINNRPVLVFTLHRIIQSYRKDRGNIFIIQATFFTKGLLAPNEHTHITENTSKSLAEIACLQAEQTLSAIENNQELNLTQIDTKINKVEDIFSNKVLWMEETLPENCSTTCYKTSQKLDKLQKFADTKLHLKLEHILNCTHEKHYVNSLRNFACDKDNEWYTFFLSSVDPSKPELFTGESLFAYSTSFRHSSFERNKAIAELSILFNQPIEMYTSGGKMYEKIDFVNDDPKLSLRKLMLATPH